MHKSIFARTRENLILACVTLVYLTTPAQAQEALGVELPHGFGVPLDELNWANPEQPESVERDEKAELPAFFADTRFGSQLKTFYFRRDKFDSTRSEAWAVGGSLSYLSGYLADRVRLGAVGYTSQPLDAHDKYDGTGLLKPGQQGFTVLGQVYAEVKFSDGIFGAMGRKQYDTPYINSNDSRMAPNTFEGATLYGKTSAQDGVPNWRFGAGYIRKIKDLDSDEFVWMSEQAGAPAGVEEGVYAGGANYENNNISIGAINYYSDDLINIFYTGAKYTLPTDKDYRLTFHGQYSDQRSVGSDLLTGSSFSTHQWGLMVDLSFIDTTFALAYTDTANAANMRSPWGAYPGFTSVQVEDFNRAGENAWLIKAAYDFSRHGVKGLNSYVLAVFGDDVNSPYFNQNEYDFNIQWTPSEHQLNGLSLRLRYAHVKQRGAGDPNINDFRLIATYDF